MRSYGYQVAADLVLCDAMTLPNASGKDSDAARWVGDQSGMAEVRVYAHTALSVAAASKLVIELECGEDDTQADAAPPFANSSGWMDTAHLHLLYKDSSDDALSFAAGDLITAMVIPQGMLRERDWIQLRFVTDADLSAQSVDAFVRVVA